jgi:hypothetical protein
MFPLAILAKLTVYGTAVVLAATAFTVSVRTAVFPAGGRFIKFTVVLALAVMLWYDPDA